MSKTQKQARVVSLKNYLSNGDFNTFETAPLPEEVIGDSLEGYILEDVDRELLLVKYLIRLDDAATRLISKGKACEGDCIARIVTIKNQLDIMQQNSADAIRKINKKSLSSGWSVSALMTIVLAKIVCIISGDFVKSAPHNKTRNSPSNKRPEGNIRHHPSGTNSNTTKIDNHPTTTTTTTTTTTNIYPLLARAGLICYNIPIKNLTLFELRITMLRLRDKWKVFVPEHDKFEQTMKEINDYVTELYGRFCVMLTGKFSKDVFDEPDTSLLIVSPPKNNPCYSMGPSIIFELGESFVHMKRTLRFLKERVNWERPLPPKGSGGWKKLADTVKEWILGPAIQAVAGESEICKYATTRAKRISIRTGEPDIYCRNPNKTQDPAAMLWIDEDVNSIISEQRSTSANNYFDTHLKSFSLHELANHHDISVAHSTQIKIVRAYFERSCSWHWDEDSVISEFEWWSTDLQYEMLDKQNPFVLELMGMNILYLPETGGYVYCNDFFDAMAIWSVENLRMRDADSIDKRDKYFYAMKLVRLWLDSINCSGIADKDEDEEEPDSNSDDNEDNDVDWFLGKKFEKTHDLVTEFRNKSTTLNGIDSDVDDAYLDIAEV
jgi:hypothetical protein